MDTVSDTSLSADGDHSSFEATWGTRILGNGRARFRFWAPSVGTCDLVPGTGGSVVPMRDEGDGWWSVETDAVPVGGAYGFRIDGGTVVPDPAARAQVRDVHGLSRLVDPDAFDWQAHGWKGRPWRETVFYELHVGTFTPEGTFDAAIGRLDHLREAGVTCVELMPVAQFAGRRGWGYDGVLLYCPHEAYGGPEGLKRLVDAAHERGMSVFLDVVYNHFGPDGNYIGAYARSFFHEEIHTPWGPGIAYEAQPVRDFMIENALYWLDEFRIDGLRLDAIDSIKDITDVPFVEELSRRCRAAFPSRHVHITTEDDRNITWHVERGDDGRPVMVSGEWNDDFHHCAHVLATHEDEGYYGDYTANSVTQMAKALATGFVYQGDHSRRRERKVGHPSGHLPPTAFVNFIQNHDQIGNRAFGDRLTDLASARVVECLQTILLLSPQIPLLFMGEEWGETRPFCFFTDFHGDLGDAVREGRRKEFRKFAAFRSGEGQEMIPDPNAESTFTASTLDWAALDEPEHAARLAMVRELLAKRQSRIVPLLRDVPHHCGSFDASDDSRTFVVRWRLNGGCALHLFANLDDEPWRVPEKVARGDLTAGELIHAYPPEAAETLPSGVLPGPSAVFRLCHPARIGMSAS